MIGHSQQLICGDILTNENPLVLLFINSLILKLILLILIKLKNNAIYINVLLIKYKSTNLVVKNKEFSLH